MPDVGCRHVEHTQRALGNATDGDDALRLLPLQKALKHETANAQFRRRSRAIRQRPAGFVRMPGEGVPADHVAARADNAPDAARGSFVVAAARIGGAVARISPFEQLRFSSERDAGKAAAAIAGCFADQRDGGVPALTQIAARFAKRMRGASKFGQRSAYGLNACDSGAAGRVNATSNARRRGSLTSRLRSIPRSRRRRAPLA